MSAAGCKWCGGQGFLYMPEDGIPCPAIHTDSPQPVEPVGADSPQPVSETDAEREARHARRIEWAKRGGRTS